MQSVAQFLCGQLRFSFCVSSLHAGDSRVGLGVDSTQCLKNCARVFLSELRQISTNFDNIWQKDGKEAKIMWSALISTSSNVRHHTTVLNGDFPNCYTTL